MSLFLIRKLCTIVFFYTYLGDLVSFYIPNLLESNLR